MIFCPSLEKVSMTNIHPSRNEDIGTEHTHRQKHTRTLQLIVLTGEEAGSVKTANSCSCIYHVMDRLIIGWVEFATHCVLCIGLHTVFCIQPQTLCSVFNSQCVWCIGFKH